MPLTANTWPDKDYQAINERIRRQREPHTISAHTIVFNQEWVVIRLLPEVELLTLEQETVKNKVDGATNHHKLQL